MKKQAKKALSLRLERIQIITKLEEVSGGNNGNGHGVVVQSQGKNDCIPKSDTAYPGD